MSSRDDLPRAIPSMWRALVRGYRAEPRLMPVAFGFSLLAAALARRMRLMAKRCGSNDFSPTEVLQHHRGLAPARRSDWQFRPAGRGSCG